MSTLIFGDSFIGPFNLIDVDGVEVYKFKGATMKGITKIENENRKKIESVVSNSNARCIIFNFGHVDLYFSYYYTKYIKKEKFNMKPIIKKYVKFVSNLGHNNCNKIIVALYPTTLKDEYVIRSLFLYGILSEDDINSIDNKDKQKTTNFNFRFAMYKKINNYLRQYCKIYNVNYINLDNILLDKNNRLKQKFINPSSNYDIHLLWEPLVPTLVSTLSKCGIKKKPNVDLKMSLDKFIKNKDLQLKETYNNK